jgi:pSer/pThr/pTyr-binding forkhead associated (FHA) protein
MGGPILLAIRVLLALSLYAFLGWALLTIWRDLQRQNEVLAARQATPITLQPQPVAGFSPQHFSTAEILIGRDPICDLCLDDKTVSAEHARLAYHHNQWWVEDLRSRNGTYLNQEAVSSPMVVASGDELRCGQVTLIVEIGGRQAAQQGRLALLGGTRK